MNRSTLTTFEMCSACGNCCKSFRFWVRGGAGIDARFSSLSDGCHKVIPQSLNPDSTLIEIQNQCSHLLAGNLCAVYDTKDRPRLCDEFPNNLFSKDGDGNVVIDDTRAAHIIEAYSDYCPAVAALRKTEEE